MSVTITRKVTVSGGTVLRAANNLGDVASAATSRANLAALGIAANLSDVASAATAFTNIKQAASTSATGVVELATDAEAVTGTDTARTPSVASMRAGVAILRNALAARGGLFFDGTASTGLSATLTGQVIATDPFAIVFGVKLDTSAPTAGNNEYAALGNGTIVGAFLIRNETGGQLRVLLFGATGSDFVRWSLSGFNTTYGGEDVQIAVVRNAAGNPSIYINAVDVTASGSFDNGGTSSWQGTVDSTYLRTNVSNTFGLRCKSFYNLTLSAADVLEIYKLNGAVPFRFQWGSQTVLNSGAFALGKRYRIVTRTDGAFTTAGAADNVVGTEWTATATAAGVLDAGDTAKAIGAVVHFALDEGIGYQLHDASANKLDAVMTTTGVSHLIAKREGCVRTPGSGISWSGSHEPKNILGTASTQRMLPDGAVVTQAVLKATVASTNGASLNSTNTAARWSSVAALGTTKSVRTLANQLPAGTAAADTDILIDPDTANYTGVIQADVRYNLAEG